jgi:hypothetical protein
MRLRALPLFAAALVPPTHLGRVMGELA